MKKRGSIKNYCENSQKNHWRRTQWNEVLRRTNGREAHQPILYLAGPNDQDRKIALDKGVPPENLIAIDRYLPNIQSVRDNGGIGICASDVLDLLWSWPKDRDVCAVMLDYCSGIEKNNVAVFDAFQLTPFLNSVVMVNLMRGRDPWSNSLRDLLKSVKLYDRVIGCSLIDGSERIIVDDPIHRGYQFLVFHAWDVWACAMGKGSAEAIESKEATMPYDDSPEWRSHIMKIMDSFNPKFYSYKSGHIVFDSCIFEPFKACHEARKAIRADPAEIDRFIEFTKYMGRPIKKEDILSHDRVDLAKQRGWVVKSLFRKVCAALAVRTTRLKRGYS